MLAIQICQREVVSASFKRKGNVLNKKKKKEKEKNRMLRLLRSMGRTNFLSVKL